MTKFKMYGIHLDQFAILCDEYKDESNINIGLNFKYAEKGKKIACITTFNFFFETEKAMVLKLTCEFEIQDGSWRDFHKDNKICIPKDLLEFFVVHTIGTARGVLFCKTENTKFNHIIIPPINVSDMGLKDLIIEDSTQKEMK